MAARRRARDPAALPSPTDPEAALVAIDPRTGAIRAMVGGRSFARSEFNLATQARRQAGSAFKPFVLVAALERGISPLEVRYGPSSLTIPDPFCETDGEPWNVSNAGDQAAGTMSIENALAGSVNTIFAQVTVEVGPEAVADVAHRMGIRSRLAPRVLDRPRDLRGDAAGDDVRVRDPRDAGVLRRADRDRAGDRSRWRGTAGAARGGRQRGEHGDLPEDADAATRVLQGVIEHGTGTAAGLADRPAAGKTGTAQHATDAWFCGYVPQLVTCVWVGYPDGARPMRNVEGYSEVYGGTIPARIWHDFMSEATADLPIVGFPAASYAYYADPTSAGPVPSRPVEPTPTDPDPRALFRTDSFALAGAVAEADPSRDPSPPPAPSPRPGGTGQTDDAVRRAVGEHSPQRSLRSPRVPGLAWAPPSPPMSAARRPSGPRRRPRAALAPPRDRR